MLYVRILDIMIDIIIIHTYIYHAPLNLDFEILVKKSSWMLILEFVVAKLNFCSTFCWFMQIKNSTWYSLH